MGFAAQRLPAPDPGSHRYQLLLPTDLSQVGEAVEAVVDCCREAGPLTSRVRFRLRTVAAEAIANAMTYGNGNDPERKVTVDLRILSERIDLIVSDEGEGFDPDEVTELSGADVVESTRGRGLFLIRRLSDKVEFNERGNTICITLPRP